MSSAAIEAVVGLTPAPPLTKDARATSRRIPERHISDVGSFASPKTTNLISVPSEILRQALVRQTLDPTVEVIEYVPHVMLRGRETQLAAIVLVKESGNYAIDIPNHYPVALSDGDLGELRLSRLLLTRAEILRDPIAANARRVWSMRNHRVPVYARMQIMNVLEKKNAVPVGEILNSLSRGYDGLASLLSLACANIVVLDISSRMLSDDTIVQRGL